MPCRRSPRWPGADRRRTAAGTIRKYMASHLAPCGPAGRCGAAARLHLADPACHLLRHRPAGPAGGQRPGASGQLARSNLVARLPLCRTGWADGGCHGGQYRHRRRHRPGAAGGCAAAHRRRDAAADAGRLGAGAAVADRRRQHRQPHRPGQPPGAGDLQQPRHPLGQLRDRFLGQEPLPRSRRRSNPPSPAASMSAR